MPLLLLPRRQSLKKELHRQEISFCRISNHYYAKVQTEKGVEQCAMQFRPGRYFFETAAGKVHMLTPTEVERYMKFVAEEVNLEAVRQQTEPAASENSRAD